MRFFSPQFSRGSLGLVGLEKCPFIVRNIP